MPSPNRGHPAWPKPRFGWRQRRTTAEQSDLHAAIFHVDHGGGRATVVWVSALSPIHGMTSFLPCPSPPFRFLSSLPVHVTSESEETSVQPRMYPVSFVGQSTSESSVSVLFFTSVLRYHLPSTSSPRLFPRMRL